MIFDIFIFSLLKMLMMLYYGFGKTRSDILPPDLAANDEKRRRICTLGDAMHYY